MTVVQTDARSSAVLLCLFLALAGCGAGEGGREAPAPESPPAAAPRSPAPPARPEEVRGTITLEGMEEPMVYRLYRAPAGFPLAFSTYLPEDMEAEIVSSGEGDVVRIVPRFGGVRNESAYLALQVLPEGTEREDAERLARDLAGRLGRAERVGSPTGGPLAEYSLRGADGRVALHRREGRYLVLVDHAPVEMGDGWAPRVRRVLEQWRWESDGTGFGG